MWTYDGILIDKQEGRTTVMASDEVALSIYADEVGELKDFFKEQVKDELKEDGLYQAEIGYGPANANQDPLIYFVKRIGDKLKWDLARDGPRP